jgi:MFS family permease
MPYLILYYNVSLGMDNYVLIMAPAVIIASVVTAFYGRFYDKKGFEKSVVPAILALATGFILLFLFKNTAMVFIGSLFMMCGYLSGMAVFGAMIRDYTPEGKAGMFQGLRIVGQVLIPGIIGPYIGALVLKNAETIVNNDGTESFVPNENIYAAALVTILVLTVVLVPLFKMLKKKED